MLRKQIALLAGLSFLPLSGITPAAWAQETHSSPQSLPVYVQDFDQHGDPGRLPELPTLGPGIIQLRLLEVPSLTVNRVSKAPRCGGQPSPGKELQPPRAVQHPVSPPSTFYVVGGSFDVHLPDVELNYSVKKCDAGSSVTYFQDTQHFTADQALEELTIAAHAIAHRLEQSLPRTLVSLSFEIEGESPQGRPGS